MAVAMPSQLLLLLILVVVVPIIFAPPGASTSRPLTSLNSTTQQGFQLTLKSVDSGQNLTRLDRLHRRVQRDNARLRGLMINYSAAGDITTPIAFLRYEFLIELAIGTPPVSFSAIMDTGSDLTWTQCAPCINCYRQNTPIFDPAKSSSFSSLPCSNNLCTVLSGQCGNDGVCNYRYSYFDNSVTRGILATETLTLGGNKIPGVAFGCGRDNTGDLDLGAGLVGLSRGPLSLISQLKEPKFSYCLPSVDNGNARGTLMLGSLAGLGNRARSAKTMRLIRNPQRPLFYYLPFQGISVGGTRLAIDPAILNIQADGSGGLFIDSGTTFTYLKQPALNVVKEAFKARIGLPADESESTGLSLCFVTGNKTFRVPSLVFHFEGADWVLPKENYIVELPGQSCLAIRGGTGFVSILGNVQQQNFVVFHDLVGSTLSFVPTKCG